MPPRTPQQLPSELPPTVMEALRKRLAERDLQAIGVVFRLRTTVRQVDNVVTEWLAGSAGSPARFQILMLLWASEGRGVPHKQITAALKVTGATVSEQMASLTHDGLVRSTVDRNDRRNLVAKLTTKGQVAIDRMVEVLANRLHAAFAPLATDDLTTFMSLLQKLSQCFEIT
jgi:DNA-binding MarR family transcriptional regulator